MVDQSVFRSLAAPITQNREDGKKEKIIRRNLSKETLETLIAQETPFWIDITDPTEEDITWLNANFPLHHLVLEDLKRSDTRPTLLAYTDYIFLSLFQPRISLKRVVGEEIHCVIGEFYFITVRQSHTDAVDDAYDRVAQNPNYWERDVAYFLYLTVQVIIDKYYPLVDKISNQLNKFEEQLLTETVDHTIRSEIYVLKQQLINLRQMISPHREVLSSVIGEERLARTSENRDLFRHLYERLMRVYDIIDSQRDLSSNVLDLVQSQEAEQLGRAVNRLTVFSMIFLPLTFIIGMFELNFISPESPFLLPVSGGVMFVGLVVIMIIIAALMVWYFRRKGWL